MLESLLLSSTIIVLWCGLAMESPTCTGTALAVVVWTMLVALVTAGLAVVYNVSLDLWFKLKSLRHATRPDDKKKPADKKKTAVNNKHRRNSG